MIYPNILQSHDGSETRKDGETATSGVKQGVRTGPFLIEWQTADKKAGKFHRPSASVPPALQVAAQSGKQCPSQ